MDKVDRAKAKSDLLEKLTAKFGKDGKFLFKVIRSSAYHQSIQDLVAYTGLSFDEVCERALLKAQDHRHFVDEYRWERPGSQNELNWFYRACRGYLFGNATRPAWDAMDALKPAEHSQVLDFGGGIGQNTLSLAKRGFQVSYFDISVLQFEFVRFRAREKKLQVRMIEPYFNGRFNFIDCIPGGFNAVVLQDVLEHIPRYPQVLQGLVSKLNPGGVILEYSPFNGKPQGKKVPRHSPVHIEETISLNELMKEFGMARTDLGTYPSTMWRKEKAP